MTGRVVCLLLAGSLLCLAGQPTPSLLLLPAAAAEEGWKTEFESVCGATDNAMSLSTDDLRKALERCDRLKEQIDRLESSPRKVYLKRLQMCRDLFAYVLASKQREEKQ